LVDLIGQNSFAPHNCNRSAEFRFWGGLLKVVGAILFLTNPQNDDMAYVHGV
jgi:hypothetical protein